MADEKKEDGKPVPTAEERPTMLMPVSTSGGLMPRSYGELIEFAKMVAFSGMVPKGYEGNTGAVLVAAQMGAELGLAPMAAIRNIAVINGRPSLWGDAMLALVKSHPECEDVIEEDLKVIRKNQEAVCTVKRRNRVPVTTTFSVEDAKEAKLWGKQGPWQQYWPRMLKMRARGFALRDAFPDALSGVRSVEEERDFIDMEPEYLPQPPPQNPVPPEGVRSFGAPAKPELPPPTPPPKEPEPAENQQAETTESPLANHNAKEAVELIKAIRDDPGAGVDDRLRLVIDTETRKTVVDAAQKKLEAIMDHQAATDAERTEMGYRRSTVDEHEPPEDEEPPPPSQAELEAAGQSKLNGAGF